MSRPHIRGPGYSGLMGAPGYEVPYASNYDSENQFFTGVAPHPGNAASRPSYVGSVGDHWYAYPTLVGPETLLYDIFGGDKKGGRSHGGHGRGGGGGGDNEFPWTTFAWASLAVVGAGVLVYAMTKGRKA